MPDRPATQSKPPLGLLALAVVILSALILCGAAQAVWEAGAGGRGRQIASAALLCLAGGALVAMFARRPRDIASLRLAVVLLALFAAACTLATLAVQKTEFRAQGDAAFRKAFLDAEAELLFRFFHPLQASAAKRKGRALDASTQERLAAIRSRFGDDYARREHRRAEKQAEQRALRAAVREWADKHAGLLNALLRGAEAAGFCDAFNAWWFKALAALLTLNLAACLLQRLRRFALRDAGFAATHAGLLLIILGHALGAKMRVNGFIGLEAGAPDRCRASAFAAERGQTKPLGFTIKLDAFKTIYHKRLVIQTPHPKRPDEVYFERRIKVKPGMVISLDAGAVELKIERVIPRATAKREIVENPKAEANPVALAEVIDANGRRAQQWLLDDPDGLYVSPDNRIKIRYVGSAAKETAARMARLAVRPSLGRLRVLDRKTGRTAECRAWPGETMAIGDYRVQVLECCADFARRNQLPLEQQRPRNPGVLFRVVRGDQAETRWAFLRVDYEAMRPVRFRALHFSLDFDAWACPAQFKLLLCGVTDPLIAFAIESGRVGPPARVRIGEPFALGRTGARLLVRRVVKHPDVRESVAPASTNVRADVFADNARPALALRITEGGRTRAATLLADDPALSSVTLRNGAVVAYVSDTQAKPKVWLARVSFYEEGRKMQSGVLRVNHPLYYRGYWIYQWDADPARPHYAGLRLVKDPAWPFVRLGLWMTLFGIVFMFYVKPFLRAEAAPSG